MKVTKDIENSRISVEEWLSELERSTGNCTEESYTCLELCSLLGRCSRWMQVKLRQAISKGSVEVVRKTMVDISGRRVSVPSYRIKPPVKKRKK